MNPAPVPSAELRSYRVPVPAPLPHGNDLPHWRQRLRASRFWILLLVLVLAVALMATFTRSGGDGASLSPKNPAPGGAQAVAEVLREQGVAIHPTNHLDDTIRELKQAGPSATLFFSDPNGWLQEAQLKRLDQAGGHTVLAAPSFETLQVFAPGIRSAGRVSAPDGGSSLDARCEVPAAIAAGTISAGGLSYRGGSVCFPRPDSAESGSPGSPATSTDQAGSLAVSADNTVNVLGYPQLLSNGEILEHGNAALALHLLGQNRDLIWYQPTIDDLASGNQPQDPSALLPPWVPALALWLLVVGLLAAYWRGRRMGPLVAEPLPVVVRSTETADGRARLYQDSQSISRAAQNLRSAAMVRIAAHLRLGTNADTVAVVAAVVRVTGQPVPEVDRLLRSFSPANESELVHWAQELDALEKEVATT